MIGRILVKVPKIPLRVLTSYGCITEVADAHHSDGKRFVVHADEKLTAFVELERAIHDFAVSLIV
jgi:hypothetical protein